MAVHMSATFTHHPTSSVYEDIPFLPYFRLAASTASSDKPVSGETLKCLRTSCGEREYALSIVLRDVAEDYCLLAKFFFTRLLQLSPNDANSSKISWLYHVMRSALETSRRRSGALCFIQNTLRLEFRRGVFFFFSQAVAMDNR